MMQPVDLPRGVGHAADPLLAALLEVAAATHAQVSAEALLAGLPLRGGRLTPELFARAAERAGIEARLARKSLNRLGSVPRPAVLLLKDGGALVLRGPEVPAGAAEAYAGRLFELRPLYRPDARAEGLVSAPRRSWLWDILLRYKREYAEVIVASVMINLFMLASPLFVMNVYDRVVPNAALDTLWTLALGVSIVFAFDFALRMLRAYFLDVSGRRVDVLMSSALVERVLGMQLRARPASSGSFASNLREIDALRDFFASATLATLIDLPFALLLVWFIWTLGGPLALVPLAAVLPVLAVGLAIQVPLARAITEGFTVGAQKHGMIVEAIEGLETIKTTQGEGRMQARWEQAVAESAQAAVRSRGYAMLGLNFAQLTQQMVVVVIVVMGVYRIQENLLTVGGLIACTILAGRALMPVAQLAGLLTRWQHARLALEALDKVMALPAERPEGKTFLHRPQLRGDIEFERVKFQYPERPTAVLDGLGFRMRAGERVAILGKVGAGKSTIGKLIVGLYAPSGGTLLVDGVDIGQIDPADLRRNVGYVPQDAHLFYGSVRDNLVGGRAPDDEAVLRAAQLAGVDRFVGRNAAGFDLNVGEHGRALSGGQRQAIAVARALLGRPPLLVLDEPSSAMDFATEAALIRALQEEVQGRTLVLITHKPSMLALVERIIVVDAGKVVADGPKQQVLQALQRGIQVQGS